MKKLFMTAGMLIMSLVLVMSPIKAVAKEMTQAREECITKEALALKEDMRRLWIDHAIWTKSYIVSSINGLENQKELLARLLKNQDDIGNAIKPYYGEEAGNKLAELLRDHILIAGKLTAAAKSGNQSDFKKFHAEWYKNADDIAKFLSSANPNWSEKELKEALYMHLQFITDDVTARLKKDWNASILAFDKGLDHLLMMADVLSAGIMKQFPDKF
ncbi:glycosyltransferase [Peribacillus frigoritolerans]|uniref:glycosyltransferase n=1 Tax=Peribacillus frigoritolerans TaxID=450367 RepID=UPI00197EB70F|nr:glycosyltransferase [Peribacillus frigoritolerans]